jgi:subtilisin family serine protease
LRYLFRHFLDPGRDRSRASKRILFIVIVLLGAAPVAAGVRDLPRAKAGEEGARGAYRADRLEIRLSAPSALGTRSRYVAAERAGTLSALGLASVDAVASALGGARFEPEFRGESPPSPGSGATDFTAFYVVHLAPGTDLNTALASFRALPDVASADPIAVLPVSAIPDDSLWTVSSWFHQASRHDIHAAEAWNLTTGDTAIVVAILDTGVLPYHPDLGGRNAGSTGNLWTNWAEAGGTPGVDDDGNGFVDDARGWDFVDRGSSFGIPPGEDWQTPDNDPSDFAGHGTAVAGLAGALTDNTIGVAGAAWKVRLMPVRVAWSATGGPLGLVDMIYAAQGIRYATRMKADVINCSFSTRNTDGLYEAAAEATRLGITIVAAAGNDGQFHELAEREDVVAVGATDANDIVTSFSNRGDFVDLSAPGNDIVSTFIQVPRSVPVQPAYVPTDNPLDGTSMSAPIVTGSIALLQSLRRSRSEPRLETMDVLMRLRETADDIGSLNASDSGYGAGRLNAYRLLADPPASSARRNPAGPTVGPNVVLRSTAAGNLQVHAQTVGDLRFYRGRGELYQGVDVPSARPVSGVAAADLGLGFGTGLFVSLNDGSVLGARAAGDPLAGWPVRISGPGTLGLPALGDLDGDGRLEVVVGASDGRVWAWSANGIRVTGFPVDLGEAVVGSVALSDLDGAPGVEIIATTEAGDIHVLGGDGSALPDWPLSAGIPISSPVIARLGSDSVAIVVGAGNRLAAFAHDGTPLFSSTLPGGASSVVTQELALGDVDGDGADEIVATLTNPPQLAAFDSLGRPLVALGWPRVLPVAVTGPPVIGRLQGVAAGPMAQSIVVMTGSGLLAFDAFGHKLRDFPKPGGAGRFPSIVDLDGTGTHQLVAGSGADSQLYVYNGETGSAAGAAPWFTPRGNFARTGSRIYSPPLPELDDFAPSAILDLAADSIGAAGVRLAWHAPGDDGGVGQAASYELRRATFALDEGNFASGDAITGVPAPAPSGTLQQHRVAGLAQNVTYWFAIRARDDAGNLGPISNVVSVTLGGVPPAPINDLLVVSTSDSTITLEWSATTDDGPSGRPLRYLVLVSDSPLDSSGVANARIDSLPATQEPGNAERFTVGGLERRHGYWLAVRARDEAGNLSRLSNMVFARTGTILPPGGVALAPLARPSRVPVTIYWQGSGALGVPQSIDVYDATGRRVRAIDVGSGPSGVAEWNGRDDHDRSIPAGIYFARLTSGSIHAHTRIVLLP